MRVRMDLRLVHDGRQWIASNAGHRHFQTAQKRPRAKLHRKGSAPAPGPCLHSVSHYIKPPLIKECPVNIECRVTQTARPGGHDMFFGEMVAVHVDEDVLDEKGQPDIDR